MLPAREVAGTFLTYWRPLFVILIPLITLPLPLVIQDDAAVCGFILIVMAAYWCTEVIPIPVTGLIPVFIMPMTGLLTTEAVCSLYYKDSMMMMTGSIIVAIAIENSNLHKRIALGILILVGARPRWLLLGFMLPTFILSMWISNTATTAMMLPIMEAVLQQLADTQNSGTDTTEEVIVQNGNYNDKQTTLSLHDAAVLETAFDNKAMDNGSLHGYQTHNGHIDSHAIKSYSAFGNDGGFEQPAADYNNQSSFNLEDAREKATKTDKQKPANQTEKSKAFNELCKGFTLSVCYSANVGGIATLTGTTPNLIMKQHADDLWEENGMGQSPVNFASWMVMGMPISCINFIILYFWLLIFYLGFRETFSCFCKVERDVAEEKKVSSVIRKEFDSLGSMRYGEAVAGLAFLAMILLWFFRSPGFMMGWGDMPIFKEGYVADAVPAVLIAVILFVIPRSPPSCGDKADPEPLITWKDVEERHPWDLIFLMGGGYAIAEACETSGLSDWLGEQLIVFQVLPGWAMILILCLFVSLMTEVTSNSATCTLLMPIMSSMAISLNLNPLYLMFPVAISSSLAFMLPVGTPPNAIAFSTGRVRVMDMVKAGTMLKICVLPIVLATETWGYSYFDFGTLPWGNNTMKGY